MMQYWTQLPNKLCVDREAKGNDENKCWNGMAIDRYILTQSLEIWLFLHSKAMAHSLLTEHKE